MKISERYALGKSQYELDFVDIDPNRDVSLFIDPHFLAHRSDRFSVAATRTLRNFFSTFLRFVRNDQLEEARDLFSHLQEPNETCLGMSKGRPSGRGVGSVQAEQLFQSLVNSRAVQTGLVEHIEDCRVFIKGFDKDKLSDLTTNVIRKHLIEYTQAQCRLWGIEMQEQAPSGWMWDSGLSDWTSDHTEMLIIDGRPILLVPKGIVSYSTAYSAGRFHRHFVLSYLQNEHLRLNSALVQRKKLKGGKESVWVRKSDIQAHEAPFDKDYLTRFTQQHVDVFRNFKRTAGENISSLDNHELTERDAIEVIDYLRDELTNIEAGPRMAGSYHRLVVGILELAFYPSLIYPEVEREINDGRKRIDIIFENAAKEGFFARLHQTHGITCPYIFIECKNYSRDVANPELDQMIGRFSPNKGKYGIVVCRDVDDMETLLMRCRDAHVNQQGTAMPLVDDDLHRMLDALRLNDREIIERLMSGRLRRVVLG